MPYYPPAGGGGGAPTTAEYLVATADGTLSAERIPTDTTGNTAIVWDFGTPAQAKATATNAGKWIKLATATASASATIDFTGLTSAYVAYKLVLSHLLPATDNVALWIRTSTNNGVSYDAGASDYRYAVGIVNSSGTNTGAGSTGAAQMVLLDTQGNATGEVLSGVAYLFNPSAAKYGQLAWVINGTDTSSGGRSTYGGGTRQTAADIDAIRIMYSSGNIASGQFDLYGLST